MRLVQTHAGKGVEHWEHSSIVLGNANYGNQYGSFLRKLGIDLPQYTPIPLLGIYPKGIPLYHKDTCSTMFIVALFIIIRNCKTTIC